MSVTPGSAESHVIRLLQEIVEKGETMMDPAGLFDKNDEFTSELFYARKSGRYQGLLHRVINDLRKGHSIQEVKL